MAELWEDLKEKLKALAGGWASYVALGSFVLYVLGYLSTRFHLTTLGIGTDLAVLDERYVFNGARFLVYLFSSIPIVIMAVLMAALVVIMAALELRLIFWPLYLLYRYVARRFPKIKRLGDRVRGGVAQWFSNPIALAILGIILSVLLIQIVMRQCFFFSNLLLEKNLPSAGLGLEQLLLDEGDTRRSLFFSALVAGTALTSLLLFSALKQKDQSSYSRFLIALLAFLVLVQFLFLPINYGVLIMDKVIPKVADLGDQVPLKQGQDSWLVWEGTQGVTYLVQSAVPTENMQQVEVKRILVTLPQKDVKRTEIIQYDQILKRIFKP